MIQRPVYVVDEIGTIVSAVSTRLLSQLQVIDSNITGVHYQFGHIEEIKETLAQKDQSEAFIYTKYPLVILVQDFSETMGAGLGIATTDNLHILIVTSTSGNYKAAERYAATFKPILYPIYLAFLDEIAKSGRVMTSSVNQLKHNKIDRVYWGKEAAQGNTKNIFNDRLDAIEITNLNLKFYQPVC